jgi:biotin carboxyl carrier protein
VRYFVNIAGGEIEVDVDGDSVSLEGLVSTVSLSAVPGTPLRLLMVDGRPTEFALEAAGPGRWAITYRGERWDAEVVDQRTRHIRSLTGGSENQKGTPPLKAPMPGLVLRVDVEPGQTIAAGSGVVVLEAMKMENELRAPVPALVRAVRVTPGQAVERGQVLVEFDRATAT